jgi:orotate phosphoribosyltransferase
MGALASRIEEQSHAPRDARLIEIVGRLSFVSGTQIVLSSGVTSTFYFDMKATLLDPEGLCAVSARALEFARRLNADFVGGLALGAVPLVAGIVQASCQGIGRRIDGFFVRKEPKSHGTERLIEGLGYGKSLQDKTALMVDDVTTTGSSVLKAVRAARDDGATVTHVLTIVDRQEGAAATLAAEGIKLVALTTAADYGISR